LAVRRTAAALLVAGSVLTSAALGAAGQSPRKLYRELLQTPIPERSLPAGFRSLGIAAASPPQIAVSHGAVGEALVDLHFGVSGFGGVAYIVFPSRADARAAYPALRQLPNEKIIGYSRAPRNLPRPAEIITMVGHLSVLSQTVSAWTVEVQCVDGNVNTTSILTLTRKPTDHDVSRAIALAQIGLRHLRGVRNS
jgi:hypothetical protein